MLRRRCRVRNRPSQRTPPIYPGLRERTISDWIECTPGAADRWRSGRRAVKEQESVSWPRERRPRVDGTCTEVVMAEQRIRVGLIGAGANTRSRHIPALRQAAGVEIAAARNRRPESTAAAAAEVPLPLT